MSVINIIAFLVNVELFNKIFKLINFIHYFDFFISFFRKYDVFYFSENNFITHKKNSNNFSKNCFLSEDQID